MRSRKLKKHTFKRLQALLTLTALATTLSACVHITDKTLYFPAGSDGGAAVEHTLSTAEDILTPEQWDDELNSQPLACMTAFDYARTKADLETMCNDLPGICTQDAVQQAQSLFLKMERGFKMAKNIKRKK